MIRIDAPYFSRTADADWCQQESVRLDRLRPSFRADDLVPEHQAFIPARARVTEEIRERFLSRHKEVLSVREVDPPLHELCHVHLRVDST